MKTIAIATCLGALLACGSLQAQTDEAPARGRLGLFFGGQNGLSYDYTLSDHFEVGGRAALGMGLVSIGSSKQFTFSGLTPSLEVTPRYFFRGREEGSYVNQGLYLALRLMGDATMWTLFPSRALRERYAQPQYAFGLTPMLGWSMPIGVKSFFRFGAGVAFYREKYKTADGNTYWETSRGKVPIQVELTYGIEL